MHIEPGIVDGAKIALSYVTAAGAIGYAGVLARNSSKTEGLAILAARSLIATVGVIIFFEVLPHFSAGVSEVHFIFGTTLLLLMGPAATGIGLILGLLIQGVFFAPYDLPQFGMNVTTLLVPLFAMGTLADRICGPVRKFATLKYADVLKLSATFQAGVVAWVAFWVIYGQGASMMAMQQIVTFAISYISVIAIEPIIDLVVLFAAKKWFRKGAPSLFHHQLV